MEYRLTVEKGTLQKRNAKHNYASIKKRKRRKRKGKDTSIVHMYSNKNK